MRLLFLKDNGELYLTDYLYEDIPHYAVLSHTWGPDSDEVFLRDIENGTAKSKVGYQKLLFCARQARKDGLIYSWVDTCCIDKSSSSELTEAIISMYRWYKEATVCYAYLADVPAREDSIENGKTWEEVFEQSRWFTRGWTLQELIAPRLVKFFSKNSMYVGSKRDLEQQISKVTKIPVKALRGRSVDLFTVEERIDWSKGRRTKRKEDQAYCLLGLLGIFMPLIYGEGEHAWLRLQEHIDILSRRLAVPQSQTLQEGSAQGLLATSGTMPPPMTDAEHRYVQLAELRRDEQKQIARERLRFEEEKQKLLYDNLQEREQHRQTRSDHEYKIIWMTEKHYQERASLLDAARRKQRLTQDSTVQALKAALVGKMALTEERGIAATEIIISNCQQACSRFYDSQIPRLRIEYIPMCHHESDGMPSPMVGASSNYAVSPAHKPDIPPRIISNENIKSPKLLKTVEDAIQRLILPELKEPKKEQRGDSEAATRRPLSGARRRRKTPRFQAKDVSEWLFAIEEGSKPNLPTWLLEVMDSKELLGRNYIDTLLQDQNIDNITKFKDCMRCAVKLCEGCGDEASALRIERLMFILSECKTTADLSVLYPPGHTKSSLELSTIHTTPARSSKKLRELPSSGDSRAHHDDEPQSRGRTLVPQDLAYRSNSPAGASRALLPEEPSSEQSVGETKRLRSNRNEETLSTTFRKAGEFRTLDGPIGDSRYQNQFEIVDQHGAQNFINQSMAEQPLAPPQQPAQKGQHGRFEHIKLTRREAIW